MTDRGGNVGVTGTPRAMSAGRSGANAVDIDEHSPLDSWLALMGVTPQEQRVVHLVERGLTNPEIAGVLGVSRHTIRNQLASVFNKLHVSRRAELVYILGRVPAGDI